MASSGRLVLAEIFPNEEVANRAEDARSSLLQTRDQSWGDQKLVETMVPGYTGKYCSRYCWLHPRRRNVTTSMVGVKKKKKKKKKKTHTHTHTKKKKK